MGQKIKAEEVLELHDGALFNNVIAANKHMSKRSVLDVLEAAAGLDCESLKDMSNSGVCCRLYSGKVSSG